MPLYEYQCPQCGRFELIQKFADPPLTSCPTCSSAVEKLLSAPAIQFKGTGWYITDYARKSSSEGGAKGEGAKSDGGKTDGAKAEPAKSSDSSTSSSTATATTSGSSGGTATK